MIMKRYFLLGVLIFTGVIMARAQVNRGDEGVQLGLKVGANLSNVYDESGQDFVADAKSGLAAGVFLRLPLGKFIGLQPEVMFSQKGFKATGSVLGGGYSLTRTSNFVDVPLLFAVKPISYLTILAGPQFSYLTKKTDVFTAGTTTFLQEQEFKNDNVRKNILCFTLGVDVNIDHLVVSARAGWDFQNNNGDGTSYTPRYKNEWYQLTVGYRLY